jgi:putative aldouronate transport system permease protein
VRRSRDDVVFDTVNIFLVTLFFLIVLYPVYFVLIASVSKPGAVATGEILFFPKGLNIEGYKGVFAYREIWIGYRNTVLYTVSGTLLSLVLTLPAAFALSRKDFVGRGFFTIVFSITMFFSGGLVPTYMLVRALGMRNTIWSQIVPGAIEFWYIVIVRTYFQTSVPGEIIEAATIDGASWTKMFMRIILPLCVPIIAVMALFYGVDRWNSYFNALIYLSNRALYPLQLILREILIQNEVKSSTLGDELQRMAMKEQMQFAGLIKYAVIVVSTLPVILVYPFLQRYFIRGIMVGALKG